MGRYSSGKFALRISDRDGQAYPYNEMVQEWTGLWVHTSEYEPKSPLLNPTNHPTDAQSLRHPKAQVVSVTVPLSGISDVNPVTGINGNTTGVSMRPLSNTTQANQDTRVISRVGTVTVSIT